MVNQLSSYVLGLAVHSPALALSGLRLEEMVYHTAHKALKNAGVTRGQLDHITLGACDELDGRSISSMLMAMPAGGYLVDEIKVTDSGATAMCLEMARLQSQEFDIGMVSSWCKSSKTDVESIMRFRGDPFYTRPFGINMALSDALFAQAITHEFSISPQEINQRVVNNYLRAFANPRSIRHTVPDESTIANSNYEALPLRSMHRAPLTDGAVSIVMASDRWLRAHPGHRPLARLSGVGWASDSYRLDRERLSSLKSARLAFKNACQMANIKSAESIDLFEFESQTGYHEAAYVRAFGLSPSSAISPSGGAFAQNPMFCTGLVCAAEAILQVAGQAGATQIKDAQRAVAHSCHGFAQQGNVVMIFEKAGGQFA